LAERPRPTVVGVAVDDVACVAVADDSLAQFIDVDHFVFLFIGGVIPVYPIHVLQEIFQRRHKLLIRWASQELQWFD
jgi:hypothetical protein